MIDSQTRQAEKACEIAEEFTRLYYKNIDTSRHVTSKLYLDSAKLIWNGNCVKGSDNIQKFLLDLPASNHKLKTLDAQVVRDKVMFENTTYLILACGDVSYQTEEARKPFNQTFVIVAEDGKWKIASDTFRLQVPYGNSK